MCPECRAAVPAISCSMQRNAEDPTGSYKTHGSGTELPPRQFLAYTIARNQARWRSRAAAPCNVLRRCRRRREKRCQEFCHKIRPPCRAAIVCICRTSPFENNCKLSNQQRHSSGVVASKGQPRASHRAQSLLCLRRDRTACSDGFPRSDGVGLCRRRHVRFFARGRHRPARLPR